MSRGLLFLRRNTSMAHREGITTQAHDWTLVRAGTLVANQKVIEIDSTLPVEDACDILIKHNISSAPIVDSEKADPAIAKSPISHGRSYGGMFDCGDMIAYILLVLHKTSPGDELNEENSEEPLEIKDIVRRALQGQKVAVGLTSDLSQRNPFYSIMPETTLLSAVEEFACGTHRVSVMGPDGAIKGILSQSTVVKYLYEHQKQFSDIEKLLKKTLRELNLGETEVVSVNVDAPVLDAFAQMSNHGVSSVAVLGQMGVVMGNISMADVKHLLRSGQKFVSSHTCFEFASHVRNQQGIEDGQDRLPVFDVRLNTTLGFTVAKLLATRSHRVWVTDEYEKAIGVLSLTDVMRAVAKSVGLDIKQTRRGSLSTAK